MSGIGDLNLELAVHSLHGLSKFLTFLILRFLTCKVGLRRPLLQGSKQIKKMNMKVPRTSGVSNTCLFYTWFDLVILENVWVRIWLGEKLV